MSSKNNTSTSSVNCRYTEPFGAVPRYLAQDETLSADALAVVTYLCSKPKDWKPNVVDIKRRFNWGKAKWDKAAKQLRDRNILTLNKTQDGSNYDFNPWPEVIHNPQSDFRTVRKATTRKTDRIHKIENTKKDSLTKKQKAVSVDENKIEQVVNQKLGSLYIEGVVRLVELKSLKEQILYHISNKPPHMTEEHAINAAIKAIRDKKWDTPYGLCSQESKRLEDDWERLKAQEREDMKHNPLIQQLSELFEGVKYDA